MADERVVKPQRVRAYEAVLSGSLIVAVAAYFAMGGDMHSARMTFFFGAGFFFGVSLGKLGWM